MQQTRSYVGIHNDINGAMTDTGKIIRDAWVFGLIPEEESCEGWNATAIENLWQRVDSEWERYGFLVSNLPDTLRERFLQIHKQAMTQAVASGWRGEHELRNDS